jgi:tRNA threonylcarbamoyladenosine biosynthesis protein TsaB
MKQLFMDTSHKYLTVACVEDNDVKSFFNEYAFKNQSEIAMTVLSDCVKEAGWSPSEVERMVISIGPGSYTGVRIAMTIAKTLAAISEIKIATTTSLECYVNSDKQTFVILDARSERVYGGLFVDKTYVEGPRVYTMDEVNRIMSDQNISVIGDLHLFGLDDIFEITKSRIIECVNQAQDVDDVDYLKPLYLKEMSAY